MPLRMTSDPQGNDLPIDDEALDKHLLSVEEQARRIAEEPYYQNVSTFL